MVYRGEESADAEAIRGIHLAAFPGRDEADLVDALRALPDAERPSFLRRYDPKLSRLAVDPADGPIGHALLSPTWLEPRDDGGGRARSVPAPLAGAAPGPAEPSGGPVRVASLVLAPVAVKPAWQGRGIGSTLVRDLLEVARADGHRLVFVLGDPAYYGRFGFRRVEGIDFPWPEHAAAFQVAELVPGALGGLRGTLTYPRPFLAL